MLAWISLIPSLISVGLEIFKAVKKVEREVKGTSKGAAKKEVVMGILDFAYGAAKGINTGNPAPSEPVFKHADRLIGSFVKVLNTVGEFKTQGNGKQ